MMTLWNNTPLLHRHPSFSHVEHVKMCAAALPHMNQQMLNSIQTELVNYYPIIICTCCRGEVWIIRSYQTAFLQISLQSLSHRQTCDVHKFTHHQLHISQQRARITLFMHSVALLGCCLESTCFSQLKHSLKDTWHPQFPTAVHA